MAELDDLLRRLGMDNASLATKLRELVKLMDTIGVTDEVVPIDLGVPETADSASTDGDWIRALDLNLTQDANFTFADGANTWHGLSWTGSNIASGTSQFAVVNGTGLFVDFNATNTIWYPPTATNTGPKIGVNLSALCPGFRMGSSRVRVTMQFSSNTDAIFEYGQFAIEKSAAMVANQAYLFGCAHFTDDSPDLGTSSVTRRLHESLIGATRTAVFPAVGNTLMCLDWGMTEQRWYSGAPGNPDTDSNDDVMVPSNLTLDARRIETATGLQAPSASAAPFITGGNTALKLSIGGFTGNTSNTLTATFKRLRVEYRN